MQLDAIRQRDPAFDQTRFLSRAEAVLALVHRARTEGRIEQTLPVVSDDMALRLRTEMEGRRTAGRHQVDEGLRVRSAQISEATADDRFDTIAVRFSLDGASYEADGDGKPVPGATRDRRRWDEVWWFQRQAGTTTTAADDAPLDRCPGCGAPLTPTADGRCPYCQHKLTSSTAWSLTRISEPPAGMPAMDYSAITFDATPVTRAARTVGLVVTLVVLVLVVGGVAAGVVAATRATKEVTGAFSTARDLTAPSFTLPGGIPVPGATPAPSAPTSTGFVTPVANPRVKAPVNDVAAAVAAVQAKAGRPLLAKEVYLYPDGRIRFEVQAADDPAGGDNWTWRGGQVTGPEQSLIGVKPTELFPLAGLDLSTLTRLCDAAIPATGIPDGVVESPYLLRLNTGLRWYIPVQSTSRRSTQKTYQVAPDGTQGIVF